jgi:antitoxin component YwqK of YwqJK toxin-antitoxin module
MTEENFIKIKTSLIEQAKSNNACENEVYQKFIDVQTWNELRNVIIDNISWCNDKGILLPDGHYKNNEREFTIINGQLNGEYIEYRSDGTLYKKCNYFEGKLHGDYFRYYKNGEVYL